MFLDWIIYSTIFYPAISYSEIKFSLISSISLSNCYLMFKSYISWEFNILNKLFFRFAWRSLAHSAEIFNCFSLNILWIVSSSLQETFGCIGTSKYSPIKASTCFLISGIKAISVGCPIP